MCTSLQTSVDLKLNLGFKSSLLVKSLDFKVKNYRCLHRLNSFEHHYLGIDILQIPCQTEVFFFCKKSSFKNAISFFVLLLRLFIAQPQHIKFYMRAQGFSDFLLQNNQKKINDDNRNQLCRAGTQQASSCSSFFEIVPTVIQKLQYNNNKLAKSDLGIPLFFSPLSYNQPMRNISMKIFILKIHLSI